MNRVLATAGREFKQFRRDRLTLGIAVALPVVLMSLYGSALTTNVRNLGVAVDDQDRSVLSARYIDAFFATNKFARVPWSMDVTAQRMLEAGAARAALRIPANFERDYRAGRVPGVQLLIDGTESNTAILLRGINAGVAQRFQASASPVAGAAPPVTLRIRHWYNPGLADNLFFGSGALGLVLILFPALLGAISAAREKELGTIVQAYASTLRAPEWVIGKAIPYILIGFVQLAICYGAGIFIFNYRVPEHPLPFLFGSACYLCAAVFYGMVVGNATGNQSAAIQGVQFGAFMLSMMLSGFLMPLANAPTGLRWLSNLVPARHFVELTRDIMLRDGNWDTSAKPLACLAGLAVLFLLMNVGRLKRMQVEA